MLETTSWVDSFQLYLFDLDGLLVNTEELHYRAYVEMCRQRGFTLPWSFSEYFQIAQLDSEAPKRYIYNQFPELERQEPDWHQLYKEKKGAYLNLLEKEGAPLMSGTAEMLTLLEQKNKKRCVVTHSQHELVEKLKKKQPILNTIPYWLTREDYERPKPDPSGYIKAIKLYAEPDDSIVGFEDSLRGMNALSQSQAVVIYINPFDERTKEYFRKEGYSVYNSFFDLMKQEKDV